MKRYNYNPYSNHVFTLNDSLNVQLDDLAHWKLRLNTECYSELKKYALTSNKGKTDPYTIFRGSDLSNFVSNWKPSN